MTQDDAVKLARLVQWYRFEDSYDKENYVLELYKEWPEIDWNHLIYYPCRECGSTTQLLDHGDALCSECWAKQPPLEPGQLAKVNETLKEVYQGSVLDQLNRINTLFGVLK